jgi:hypothetical protein
MSKPDASPAPPAIRSLAERIERALRGPIGPCPEDDDFTEQSRADREMIRDDYRDAAWDKGKSFENAARIARTSWLYSILTEALGGEGRGGEQTP